MTYNKGDGMSRKKNKSLKFAIIERDRTQKQIAREAGMSEATLSLIINGVYNPSVEQQQIIARILGKSPKELF